MEQNDLNLVFTMQGAIVGFIAYLVLGCIVAAVFI